MTQTIDTISAERRSTDDLRSALTQLSDRTLAILDSLFGPADGDDEQSSIDDEGLSAETAREFPDTLYFKDF